MLSWLNETFEKALRKYERGAALAQKQSIIPYMSVDGQWSGPPYDGASWWTNGFYPGLMWQLYAAEPLQIYKSEALRVEELLAYELERYTLLNHDVGFMYLLSSGARDRLEPDELSRRRLLHAASLLAGRFNPNGFITAWNGNRPGWAIIDCMMNLSLLYQASELTGDPRFELIARAHADTSIREFVRTDGSCHHIVIFDPKTGIVLDKPGGQGYKPGSSWSRGQAWALYGFTISYMHTGEARYLDTARKIADYFISSIRPDGLTDCDFRQPEGEERIDNIAGACAACGLLELSKLTDDGERYRSAAIRMLRAMDELCADWSDKTAGILTKCTASYHDDGAGRHVNILYGDYFFIEALCKVRCTDLKLWMPREDGAKGRA